MKRICLIFLLFSLSLPIYSQHLHTPRNIKAAYESNTGAFDERPGENYFQNKSMHKMHNITISVEPPNRRVTGTEEIVLQK